MMDFVRTHAQAIAYLLIAVVAALAIDLSANHTAHTAATTAARVLYRSQLQACQRGNKLRRQINDRTHESATSRGVLISFLRSARRARLDSYRLGHQAADLRAANAYGSQIKREQRVHFTPVLIIDCHEAFPAP